MKKDYNGPAFPGTTIIRPDGRIEWGPDGMSLRDYFAAKAMQGFLASWGELKNVTNAPILAKNSYIVADAMLEAREGK